MGEIWSEMYIGPHVQYPLFLPILIKLQHSKNIQILNFMKIRPVGDKIFHADERTDTTKVKYTKYV